MRSRRSSRVAAVGLVACVLIGGSLFVRPAEAHVGSPNVFFEGMAGSYQVRVVIRPPAVVPGQAEITVRLAAPVESVAIRLFRWDSGLEGAPPAEEAVPVRGETGLFSSTLWLMTSGAHSVQVQVVGPDGEGTALVPFESIRRGTLEMEPIYGAVLAGMALFLFVGAATIFGASVRESTLAPGEVVDAHRTRRGRVATVVGAVALGLLIWGGWNWWTQVDAVYRSALYRPLPTAVAVVSSDAGRVLDLSITDERWIAGGWTPLAPDHGKLMHMFLVRTDLSAFAHVHPTRVDHDTFRLPVPGLPAGSYRLYADIVHESGFSQTLVNQFELPALSDAVANPADGEPAADPDDSWAEGLGSGTSAALADGGVLQWIPPAEPIVAGRDLTLEFEVLDASGNPAILEPYMGMLSHSAITRADGEVFVHLHPSGSISMGALSLVNQQHDVMGAHPAEASTGRVAFPYAFPRSGTYRMWVQIKRAGRVETGNFEIEVQ